MMVTVTLLLLIGFGYLSRWLLWKHRGRPVRLVLFFADKHGRFIHERKLLIRSYIFAKRYKIKNQTVLSQMRGNIMRCADMIFEYGVVVVCCL